MTSKKAIDKYTKRLTRSEPLAPPSTAPPQTLGLLPHEIAFAEWLAACPKRPRKAEQLAVMMEKAAARDWDGNVTHRYIDNLKRRQEFLKFFAELQRDALSKARAIAQARAPEYIKADYEGLLMALDRQDYKTITQYTSKVYDRVWPKKDETVPQVAVKIELTERQLREVDQDEIIVEGELIDDDA